jgi:hypothetical protein
MGNLPHRHMLFVFILSRFGQKACVYIGYKYSYSASIYGSKQMAKAN